MKRIGHYCNENVITRRFETHRLPDVLGAKPYARDLHRGRNMAGCAHARQLFLFSTNQSFLHAISPLEAESCFPTKWPINTKYKRSAFAAQN